VTESAPTYDEIVQLLEAVGRDEAVVVGGQAMMLWAQHLIDRHPELNFLLAASFDVDFYGNLAAAERLAAVLGKSRLSTPKMDDNTVNAAVVRGLLNDVRPIHIDFMRALEGVEDASIRENAVMLEGADPRNGQAIAIRVLHPLDCLRSRLANINVLRRTSTLSVMSAKAAVLIVQAFVEELLDAGAGKEAQRVLMDLEFIARDAYPTLAFKEFGIDPADAMRPFTKDERLDDRWRAKTFCRALSRLEAKAASRRKF
jgi:hypothetical protein